MKSMNDFLHFPHRTAGDEDPGTVGEAISDGKKGWVLGAALNEIAGDHADARASGTNDDEEDEEEDDEEDEEEDEDEDDEAAADEEMEEEDEDEEADEDADESLMPASGAMPTHASHHLSAESRHQRLSGGLMLTLGSQASASDH